jgi:TRAP-type C4-dicarboxylate transport system permease small subunit
MGMLTSIVVRLADLSSILLRWALGLTLAALLGAVAIQVVGRHVLHATPPWTEVFASLMMTWISFLGAAYAIRTNENMAITVLDETLRGPFRTGLGIIIALFSGWFAWLLLTAGTEQLFLVGNATIIGLPVSTVWLYLSAPVSAVFMFLFLLEGVLLGRHQGSESVATP